ncbi:MAG: polysaccharide deacetylase family protein [Flavobacteriaceae bacterium]|nr:polysaccharide deacetylase family protein [Flavobacteriaceae bacterium]
MKSYPAKIPKIIQSIFKSFIWSLPTNKNPDSREIYLTFDDGPIPKITPWVLQMLSDYNAKATFFCIGENIKKYPDIFQKILNDEHSIGNHTYNHLNGWKTTTQKYLNNISQVENLLKLKTRSPNLQSTTSNQQLTTNLFRPPYGKINPQQAKPLIKKGYKIIMWDVLSGDFDQNLKKEDCFQNVIKHTEKGSIIVFHDSEKAFKNLRYTLPKTLELFSEKGYVFKAL